MYIINMGRKPAAAKIRQEIIVQAHEKLDEVMNLLKPCFEVLAQPELWVQDKIGAASMEFLILSHKRAGEFPELFPGSRGVDGFNEEFITVNELWILAGKLEKLKNNIGDMITLAGNHTLEIAHGFYATLKIAAQHDLPGARVLLEELKPVYPAGKRRHMTSKNPQGTEGKMSY